MSSANSEKRRIALTSVIAAVFITGMKLIVGLKTNSLGILSEAAHSGLDFVAAAMTYFAVSVADKPADKEHPYGHGKIENLSALFETALLFITCGWIIWEAINRLVTRASHVEANFWGFAVMAITIVIDFGRSRALKRTAIKHNSQALEADALHFSSDVWSSLVVIVGLVFVSFGVIWVDAVASIGVALLVLLVSYRLGRRTMGVLMDRAPEGLYEFVLGIVNGIPGVHEVRSVRLRQSGPMVFIDTTIAIARTTPFQRAHTIMDAVEKAVETKVPNADVVVHAEPYASSDETIADKVRMIVVGLGLHHPHNMQVHLVEGRYHVDFDIEHKRGVSLVSAHDVASQIEERIYREIPEVERVVIHMEEIGAAAEETTEVTDVERELSETVCKRITGEADVIGCDDLKLLRRGDKYNLTLTCRFARSMTLNQVHDTISRIETQLHNDFPMLGRIMIHAEPAEK